MTHLLSRRLLVFGALLLLANQHAIPARAQPSTEAAMMRLDDRLVRSDKVRIQASAGWMMTAYGTRASVDGLGYAGILTSTSPEALPPTGRLAWNDISRVDVPVNHGLRTGLITGLALTGIAAVSLISATNRGEDIGGGGAALLLVPVVAVLVGGVSAMHHSWHRVYAPPRTAPK